ncbi:hypothetical protein GGTG_02599 [Gaeumannomyces tritici R3-111a-1]|uniref:Uncharacterized protein n=1 Tax=Gaeumannomyces tritici (strain R3-111a-1) TaxID=644352 RepID=J3NMU0_GAET3|nr:hypothetical protein GGTG_02599 [Gaeumannomyces tritici R3-111a-1]EJT77491.1 hypothetical protein GGTG_02599 [Gaeumannomyces tritici R3-111a-1]
MGHVLGLGVPGHVESKPSYSRGGRDAPNYPRIASSSSNEWRYQQRQEAHNALDKIM